MKTALRLALALLSLSAALLVAAPAHAADYYRYWGFFSVTDGSYVAEQKGVGATTPADGSVIAFRFAAPANFDKPNLPRVDPAVATFDAVCADTDAADGQKRVAVILDAGVSEDADGADVADPSVECAQVTANATALQVLQSVAEARTKTSSFGPLLCGIDGYPATGCADEVVATASPADSGFVEVAMPGDKSTPSESGDRDSDAGSSTALYVGLGVVVLLLIGGGAVVVRRRGSAG